MSEDYNARSWWAAEIRSFTAELGKLRCVHLDTRLLKFPNDVTTFIDLWLHEGVTFVDLVGNRVAGHPVAGVPHGLLFAQFRTWKEASSVLDVVCSTAEKRPRSRAPGVLAFLLQSVLAPFLARLGSEHTRATSLRTPGDLGRVLERHWALVIASPGTVFEPPADALEWRWEWQERQEAECERSAERRA